MDPFRHAGRPYDREWRCRALPSWRNGETPSPRKHQRPGRFPSSSSPEIRAARTVAWRRAESASGALRRPCARHSPRYNLPIFSFGLANDLRRRSCRSKYSLTMLGGDKSSEESTKEPPARRQQWKLVLSARRDSDSMSLGRRRKNLVRQCETNWGDARRPLRSLSEKCLWGSLGSLCASV